MNRIFQFILKNYFFVLFLVLEIISFSILVSNQNFHRTAFFSSSNTVAARVSATASNISDYFYLKRANQQLASENAELRSRQMTSFKKVDKLFYSNNDTIYRQQYNFAEAKIINNSVNRRNNFITLNKGRLHGIEPEMGVITHLGIIGVVKNVSNNFSSVISILHKDSKVSAKIKKNGYVGSIAWEGKDYRTVGLQDIPSHVKLEVGDTIISSGFSAIFPEGIPIGTIKDFELSEGDSFYQINVMLFVDFKKLSYVSVVQNLFKYEQKQLEEISRNE